MKGDTPYWYDFDEFNLDGLIAQQAITFHYKKYSLFKYFSGVLFIKKEAHLSLFFAAVTCYYKNIDSKIPLYM